MKRYQNHKRVLKDAPARKSADVRLVVMTSIVLVLLALAGYGAYIVVTLPRIDRLQDYKPLVVTQVYGDDGVLVGDFSLERRIVVPIQQVPRRLVQAFIAAEDASFYAHRGIDYVGVVRAMIKNIIAFRKKEGASTITQQVTKTMLLTSEKKISRKIKEAILATRLEKKLTKDEILYLYLNQIYLGSGSYGVEAASQTYFGKSIGQLNLAEMAMLAGLPKAPNAYSPIKNYTRAKERQGYVLDRMLKEGFITQAEADNARQQVLTIQPNRRVMNDQVAYFLEQIKIYLEQKYGEEMVLKGGLRIYTTMNAPMQKAAYEAIRTGLKAVDKQQGFRGGLKFLSQEEIAGFCEKAEDGIESSALRAGEVYQGVVTAVQPATGVLQVQVGERTGTIERTGYGWAGRLALEALYGKPEKPSKTVRLGTVLEVKVLTPDRDKRGAVFLLEQTPEVQGALVSLDPANGAVKAMVGGYDFRKSQFNRVMQSRRNAGSAFKPIVYAAALEKGLPPTTIIEDAPVQYSAGFGRTWAPKNYDNKYRGPVSLREALTHSINIVSVKLLDQIGVATAVDFAKRLGFTSTIEPNLSLALGAASVTPFELTSAYTVFANNGIYTKPFYILKVVDGAGRVLEEYQPPPEIGSTSETAAGGALPDALAAPLQRYQATSPHVAHMITSLMQSVVQSGTGFRAAAIRRPVAGKTGTTNGMRDAWFVGYVPQLVTGVWVGFDNQARSLGGGGSGGQAAAPIWADYMMQATQGMPVIGFVEP